jgi:ribonuclease HI
MQIIITITYSMWLARNKKVFQNHDIPANETVETALRALQEYNQNKSLDQITSTAIHPSVACDNTSWSPPPKAYLKLNVDAHLSSDGHLGLGLVLRDEDGRIVGASTKAQPGSGNMELSETLGLVEALRMIEMLKLRSVIIEMDAATIVRAIQAKSYPRNHWGQMAQQCARVIDEDETLSICWVSRTGNEMAHVLARWALSEPNRLWTENFPPCITQQVQKDLPHVTPT